LDNALYLSADLFVDLINGFTGVNDTDSVLLATRLQQESGSDASMVIGVAAFDSIGRTDTSLSSRFHGQVEDERQIRFQATGGEPSDFPESVDWQPARVPLVHDVGQQIAIGDDISAGCECRLNDLSRELRPAGHEQKGLASGHHLMASVQQ
jgi:hypothetical protein